MAIAARIRSVKRLRQAAFVRGHLERLDQLSKGTHQLWQMRWAERRVEEGRLRIAALRNIRTLFKGFGEPRELARLARRLWRDADLDLKTNPTAVAALRSIMLQRTKDLRVRLAVDTAEVLRETAKMAQESTRLVLLQQKERRELRLVQPVAKQRSFIDVLGPRMHDEMTSELVESVAGNLEHAFEGYAGDLANTIVEASNPAHPLTMSQLAGELENDFLGISRKRAMLIARTESARVYGAVSLNEMRNLGIKERRWLTAAGSPAAAISPVCQFCVAMANQGWVSVNEQIQASLTVGIRSPQQQEISGHYPPFHPNCRCDIQANVDDWFPEGAFGEIPELPPIGTGFGAVGEKGLGATMPDGTRIVLTRRGQRTVAKQRLQTIVNAFGKVPSRHVAGLNLVDAEAGNLWMSGGYVQSVDDIWLMDAWAAKTETAKVRTLVHEIGHRVQTRLEPGLFKEFKRRGFQRHAQSIVSGFKNYRSAQLAGEAFAESYALYALEPEVLLQLDSELFAFWEAALA